MQNCNYHIHRIVNIIEMDDGIDFANKDKMYELWKKYNATKNRI